MGCFSVYSQLGSHSLILYSYLNNHVITSAHFIIMVLCHSPGGDKDERGGVILLLHVACGGGSDGRRPVGQEPLFVAVAGSSS